MSLWKRGLGLVALGAVGLFGCQGELETYTVSPFKVPCGGEGSSLCALGIHSETGEGTVFDEIEGFGFRWGVIQEIRISVHEVKNPPADGSSLRYVLEDLLEAEPVPEGVTFGLRIDQGYLRGSKASGYSLVGSARLTCASSEVCDALEQQLGTSEPFSLRMGYPSTEGEPLIIMSVD